MIYGVILTSWKRELTKQTDILFVSMPSRANSNTPPISFLYLAGFLDKHTSFQSAILDYKIPIYKEATPYQKQCIKTKIFTAIEMLEPRFIGFSLLPADWFDFLELAKEIKNRFDVKIIAGGVLPTVDPESLKGISKN